MRILPKLGALGAAYSFLRSPTGRRILDEARYRGPNGDGLPAPERADRPLVTASTGG